MYSDVAIQRGMPGYRSDHFPSYLLKFSSFIFLHRQKTNVHLRTSAPLQSRAIRRLASIQLWTSSFFEMPQWPKSFPFACSARLFLGDQPPIQCQKRFHVLDVRTEDG